MPINHDRIRWKYVAVRNWIGTGRRHHWIAMLTVQRVVQFLFVNFVLWIGVGFVRQKSTDYLIVILRTCHRQSRRLIIVSAMSTWTKIQLKNIKNNLKKKTIYAHFSNSSMISVDFWRVASANGELEKPYISSFKLKMNGKLCETFIFNVVYLTVPIFIHWTRNDIWVGTTLQ